MRPRHFRRIRADSIGGRMGLEELSALAEPDTSALKELRRAENRSSAEAMLEFQLKAAGLTGFEREATFCPRKYRLDFAFRAERLGVEIQGFGRGGALGRHQSFAGVTDQCEKHSLLAIYGWRLIEATAEQVKSGVALKWIEAALGRARG